MKHYMHLKEKPFRSIWEGNKTIELRLYDEKRRAVKVGDQIEFDNLSNPGQLILVNVIAIYVFESLSSINNTPRFFVFPNLLLTKMINSYT